MKNKEFSLLLLTFMSFFIVIACSSNSEQVMTPSLQEPNTVLTRATILELLPERKDDFKNTLELHTEIIEIQPPNQPDRAYNPNKIILVVYFKNISTEPLVIRLPQSVDFQGQVGSESILDLSFFIESPDSEVIVPSLIFSPVPDRKQITSKDFVTIKPGDSYSMNVELEIPYFNYKSRNYFGNLLPGSYTLFCIYENYMFGYRLPVTETPPPKFDSLSQEDNWRREHTMEVDLNAWVGIAMSEKVDFIIPED